MENKTLLILNQVNSQTLKQKHDFSSTQHKYSNLSKALSASKKIHFPWLISQQSHQIPKSIKAFKNSNFLKTFPTT
jgi:hypothetical protein